MCKGYNDLIKKGTNKRPVALLMINILLILAAITAAIGVITISAKSIGITQNPEAVLEEKEVIKVTHYPNGLTFITSAYAIGQESEDGSISNWQGLGSLFYLLQY